MKSFFNAARKWAGNRKNVPKVRGKTPWHHKVRYLKRNPLSDIADLQTTFRGSNVYLQFAIRGETVYVHVQ